MQLSLEGIGAALSSDNGFTVIEELVPGGGAERWGLLKPKDKIIAVAYEGERPVDVIDMDGMPVWFMLEDIGETALDYPLPVQAITSFLGVPGKAAPPWKS